MKKPHASFEKTYRTLALPLMKFTIKRMGGDQEAAEEVFSQTIASAWKSFSTFEHKSKFFTWLCCIALNKIADYYRDQINERSRFIVPALHTLANLEDKNLSLEEKLVLDELRFQVNECLNLLPPEKRQLLQWRFWQEMSIKKIAHILGVSERSAEGKLYRAKLAFREAYQTKYPI